ncbi:MAG: FHA domain-containing protein [Betaproteobacteria bacterium]
MKPILPDAASGVPDAAKPSIADQLRSIDMSVLDRLIAIRQEEARLDEFRARAEGRKTQVSDAVYKRVIGDYGTRSAALEREASPLRVKARSEYRKLRQLVDHITQTYDQAKLEKEELEFRHEVGELDDDTLGEHLKKPQQVLDDCQSDMACIEEHKARFVDALGSEEALNAPEPAVAEPGGAAGARSAERRPAPVDPPPAAATSPSAATAPSVPAVAPASTGVGQPAARADAPRQTGRTRVAAAAAEPDATVMVSAEETRLAAAPVAGVATTPSDDDGEGRTLLVPLAALVADPGALPRTEYPLGALNYVGRSDDNQIQIVKPGVSRKHAAITVGPGGFIVKDLGSQNGVRVNGERITERALADGDRIEIAGVSVVFRSPWPVRGAATAAPKRNG